MKVLLVEDDELKASKLTEYLAARLANSELTRASSLNSAIQALADSPELVVLDMTLPAFDVTVDEDGGTKKPYGGRELLRQLEARDLETPAIVVTQYDRFGDGDRALTLEQLDQQLRESYDGYLGVVKYRANQDGWKDALDQVLKQFFTPEIPQE